MENLIVGIIIVVSIYFTVKRVVRIFKGETKCNCSTNCSNNKNNSCQSNNINSIQPNMDGCADCHHVSD